jgi:hypothetical protein
MNRNKGTFPEGKVLASRSYRILRAGIGERQRTLDYENEYDVLPDEDKLPPVDISKLF